MTFKVNFGKNTVQNVSHTMRGGSEGVKVSFLYVQSIKYLEQQFRLFRPRDYNTIRI